MQVENDYDKDVYNGDLGVVSRIGMEKGELAIDFDGREVSYGFGELDELLSAQYPPLSCEHQTEGAEPGAGAWSAGRRSGASHPACFVKTSSLQASVECQSTEPVDNPVHKPPARSRNLAGFLYFCSSA